MQCFYSIILKDTMDIIHLHKYFVSKFFVEFDYLNKFKKNLPLMSLKFNCYNITFVITNTNE